MNVKECLLVVGRNILEKRFAVRQLSSQRKYGQPTPATHPHLLKGTEVNVNLSREEFSGRRDRLVSALLQSNRSLSSRRKNKGIVIVPSSLKQYMVDKIPYFFRQDTDFRYLTGCLQPESLLIIQYSDTSSRSYLFLKQGSSYDEKWEGTSFGLREAEEFLGIDESVPIRSLGEFLLKVNQQHPDCNIWYDFMEPRNAKIHKVILDFITDTNKLQSLEPIRPVLHSLRSIKTEPEIELMRKTCQIGAEAMKSTIAKSRNLRLESDFLATVDYESRILGANHLAYPPVVAAGNNANTIHHISANGCATDQDLVLLDSGTEYHGYSSDITRTWPVSGSYSPSQRCLYEIVLDCQEQLIASIVPGVTSLDSLYQEMLRILGDKLLQIGLVPSGQQDRLRLARAATEFCPHNVGHHLGMDVHDCGTVSKASPLTPGMVITVEPGLYIPASNTRVPSKFRGIGIRIEDDILITSTGCEILSRDCPKKLSDIEELIE